MIRILHDVGTDQGADEGVDHVVVVQLLRAIQRPDSDFALQIVVKCT